MFLFWIRQWLLVLGLGLFLTGNAYCGFQTKVLVYGGTPAGIAAAIAASRDGVSVMLVEPTNRIGGMTTNGLSHPDFRTFEGMTGFYYDFTQRCLQHYKNEYGEDSKQVRKSFRGTHSEPKVNLTIFEEMLAEHPSIVVMKQWRLKSNLLGLPPTIGAVNFEDVDGVLNRVKASVFIDATYEGDLMRLTTVPSRYGREGRDEYGESLAPLVADKQVQGYNFRLVMTQDEDNRVYPSKPDGYNRELFAGVVPLLEDGRLKGIFGYSPSKFIYKAQIPNLPNGKLDINDVSHSPVRLSLPDVNDEYPDAKAERRQEIFQKHVLWNTGLLYFLQNDEVVPARFRKEAMQWGLCRDEFVENSHMPEQLYIREARRMVGQYVFTENDTNYAEGDARAMFHQDAIAMGDYGPNCHGTAREGTRFDGKHRGEFYKKVPPYQIPYGVLIPQEMNNLLVPVAVSASHVGFCALRLEPIWSSLGQAAGVAANLAVQHEIAVQDVSVEEVQSILHQNGAATIYMSDVLPGHPDFTMVQWWGSHGGFHGLAPMPDEQGQRGEHIVGQYFKAYPDHDAKLNELMNGKTEKRWRAVALSIGVKENELPVLNKPQTRKAWLQQVWKLK